MKATHKRGDGPYLDLGDQWNLYTGWDIFPNFSNFSPISFHTNQIAWKLLCIVTGTPHSRSSDYMRCGPDLLPGEYTSAIVFLLSNFQPSSGTDHYRLTRLPDQTISFSLLADLRTRRLSMWSDRQTRQSYCYQTTRLDNVPITCIRPPEQTTLLLSDHQTRPFSCQHSITPEHFPLSGNAPAKTISSGRPPGQTTFRLSLTIQQQICTEHPYPPDLHPGQDISSWVGSYGGLIYIYRILNEPCKVYVYFPHTFSGKTLDFLLRLVFCFVLF